MTTPEHPFARVGTGWTRAADLGGGDRIETQSTSGGVTILDKSTFDTPGTVVHNFTVATTHAYFVGPQGLLVHNDCGMNGAPVEVPESERRPHASQQTLADLLAEARREEAEARREKRSRELMVKDEHGPFCAYCVLTGLSDTDKLSIFFQNNGVSKYDGNGVPTSINLDGVQKWMKALGMTSSVTPSAKHFPAPGSRQYEKSIERHEADPNSTFPYAEQSIRFMQQSSANTFVVAYPGHALMAVKQADGSILYLDLSKTPPHTYEHLDPHLPWVAVVPTDIDWRFNRILYGNVQVREPREHTP